VGRFGVSGWRGKIVNNGTKAAKDGRNDYIDSLRGLSIFVVIFLHYCGFLPANFAVMSGKTVNLIGRNGYYGVTIFFVVSGFLITSHAIKRFGSLDRIKPHEFYQARFARIYPLLLAVVAILIFLDLVDVTAFKAAPNLSIWKAAWAALTFQFNWYYVGGASVGLLAWAPLWSLAVEELFYILFPVICLGLRRPALIAVALIVLIIQAPLARTTLTNIYYWSGCADAIAMGCLTALVSSRMRDARQTPWIGAALRWSGLALIAWRYFSMPIQRDFVFGPSIIALGAATCLLGAVLSGKDGPILFLPLKFIGRRSYEIYLIHTPILMLMKICIGAALLAYPDAIFIFYVLAASVSGEIIGSRFTDPMNKRIRSWPTMVLSPAMSGSALAPTPWHSQLEPSPATETAPSK
jgi:peptidoglycan/LPS O-acetylase OafA/YrhL